MLLPNRVCLLFRVVLLTLLLLSPSLCQAKAPIVVSVDAAAAGKAFEPLAEGLAAWQVWARLDQGTPLPVSVAPSLPARAARFPEGVGIAVVNDTEGAIDLRVEARVPRGLWRVDAAVVAAGGAAETAEARTWRMESALQQHAGTVTKPVTLRAGQALFLRLTDTVTASRLAYRRVLAAKTEAETDFLRGRIGRALSPVESALGGVPPLVAKGDRVRIAQKAHRALLAAAQAQAVWKNGRGAALADHDASFDALMTALSEISCAAYNLVPRQTEVVGEDGARSLRVSVTNAGKRTVPLVSLGVQEGAVDREAPSRMAVFGALAPGEQVAATFQARGAAARGVVQFILSMGAAIVAATPPL